MSLIMWTLLLFLMGAVEFWIDQYQKIALSRLKIGQAVGFQTANQYFTLLANVYAFGAIADFWNKIRTGVYDFKLLIPYAAYIHGCIIGTAIAIIVYKARKKTTDRSRRIQLLEKARIKKAQLKNVKKDVNFSISETFLSDDLEREDFKEEVIERTVEQMVNRISKGVDQALNEQEIKDGENTEDVRDQDPSEGKGADAKRPDPPSA